MGKSIAIFILLLFVNNISFSKKPAFRYGFSSGLFYFSGVGATKYSELNSSKINSYTNNPYGTSPDLCYGVFGSLYKIKSKSSILGIEFDLENLRSKSIIDKISLSNDTVNKSLRAFGKTNLNSVFLNVFPYLGKKFKINNTYNLQLTTGLDVGYSIISFETGLVRDDFENLYTVKITNRKTINFDIRPRIQLNFENETKGVYFGFSEGLSNYKFNFIGGVNNFCTSNYIRFGFYLKKL